MVRLKVAKSIQKGNYTPARVARKLTALIETPRFAEKAESVARQLGQEDGVKTACDALEELFRRTRKVD
jgi:UDP:flavonoid glycosyltransferase YjiC (YdhE family)